MPTTPPGAELLERSLCYLRVVLSRVTDADLARATPCRGWDVNALLDHLDDALDAFAEAAVGTIDLATSPHLTSVGAAARPRVAGLRAKAGALLGDWSAGPPTTIAMGGLRLTSHTIATAGALETAVHGWDVADALGVPARAPSLPVALAEDLWPVAQACVHPTDRGRRFDPALTVPPGVGPDVRLLAHLGRRAA